MNKNIKGTKWALSSVATCAAALSFMIVTNSSLADETSQNNQNTVSTVQVQSDSNNSQTSNVQNNSTVTAQTTSDSAVQTNQTTTNGNVATTQATTQQPVATSNDQVPSGGSVYDDYPNADKNPLGIAAYFHIFSNDATLNAHTNGNVAVKNLDGNVNFGTNIHEELLDQEISYIQNITNIANSSFVSSGDTRTNKVVFGENVNIDVSNPNRVNVDGKDIDHLTAGETYQDKNGQVYIDFEKEFQKLRDKSTELSNTATVNPEITNSDFEDQNNRVIDVSDYVVDENNQIILNLSPDVLNSNTPLTIKGIASDEEGPTVIINVNTDGASEYNVNSPIKIIYDDGSERNSKETEYFGDNHLLWNFTDKTSSNKLHDGTINMNSVFQGSVLAPDSTINVGQNLDGNIIADKVNVNAETHRWDLQDPSTREEEEEEYETPNIDNPDVEIPTYPEEPGEPETPGTTDPEQPETPGTTDPEQPETPGTTDPEQPETPGTTDPEQPETPGTTDPEQPETPGTTDPEQPETPGTTDPEQPETPGTTDPEQPETPGTTDPEQPETPGTVDPEEPGTVDPSDPDPIDPDTDGVDEEDDLITEPGEVDNNNSSSTNDKNNLLPEVPYAGKEENKNSSLPQTGAKSSLLLSAIGLAMAAGLGYVLTRKRRV